MINVVSQSQVRFLDDKSVRLALLIVPEKPVLAVLAQQPLFGPGQIRLVALERDLHIP